VPRAQDSLDASEKSDVLFYTTNRSSWDLVGVSNWAMECLLTIFLGEIRGGTAAVRAPQDERDIAWQAAPSVTLCDCIL
jgi:hypothetical protein